MKVGSAFIGVATVTFLSRISGFIRIAVFAAFYGSSLNADVFLSVMIIPEIMYRFVSDGLISSAAVPMFVKLRDNLETTRKAFGTLFFGLLLFSLPIVALGIIGAEYICEIMVPGFSALAKLQMVVLFRLTVPYFFLALAVSLFVSLLNAHGIFVLPAVGPIFVNFTVIAGILISKGDNIFTATLSLMVGAIIQFIWVMLLSKKIGVKLLDCLFIQKDWEFLIEFCQRTAPIAAWIFLSPIIPLFERYLLSSQAQGSVAILNYCEKILYLPLGIISISLTSVIFPLLAIRDSDKSEILYNSLWSLMSMLWPLIVLLVVFPEQVIEIIYKRGEFGINDVILSGKLLKIYSLSLLPVSGVMLINRFFFALGNSKIPFLAGICQILVQIILDMEFISKLGPVGLAWGAVIATSIQVIILLVSIGLNENFRVVGQYLRPFVFGSLVIMFVLSLFPENPPNDSLLPLMGKLHTFFLLCTIWLNFQIFSIVFSRTSLAVVFLKKYSH